MSKEMNVPCTPEKSKAQKTAEHYLASAFKTLEGASMYGVSPNIILYGTSHVDFFLDTCARANLPFAAFQTPEGDILTAGRLINLFNETVDAIIHPMKKSAKISGKMWDDDVQLIEKLTARKQSISQRIGAIATNVVSGFMPVAGGTALHPQP